VAGLALCSLGLAGLYVLPEQPVLALMEISSRRRATSGVMPSETTKPKAAGESPATLRMMRWLKIRDQRAGHGGGDDEAEDRGDQVRGEREGGS